MKNIVTKEDLKGNISDFPLEIVQAMCDEQVRQGNKFNPKVFQNSASCGLNIGGFEWTKSKLGALVWESIISNNNFEKFYEYEPLELSITEESVKNAFKNADENGKKMLKDLFGDQIKLYTDITERVKSFEDACEVLGISKFVPDVSLIPSNYQKKIISEYKLMIIMNALNEGWKPNWEDKHEDKYYPRFSISTDKILTILFEVNTIGNNYINTSFLFKNEKLLLYFGYTFIDLIRDVLDLNN